MNTKAFKLITFIILGMFMSGISAFSQVEDAESDNGGELTVLAKGPKFGTDSIECVKNISLYREYYRMFSREQNEAYIIDAIPSWRYVFLNCPLASQNTFIDGIVIMKYLHNKETDPELKEKYVDTLMMIYDKRIESFGREGFVLGRKGADMLQYRAGEINDIYNTFKRSYELRGDESEGAVLYYYFIAATNYVRTGNADTSLVLSVYDQVSTSADKNIRKGGKSNYRSALDNIEVAFTPWASCKDLIGIYEVRFKENPQDIELLKKITSVLDRKACTESDLYFKAARELHKLEPSAESAMAMGRMSLSRRLYSEAIGFFDQSIGLLQDDDRKVDALLLQADAYRQINNLSASRNSALRASSIRPNDGRPYLIIGDLYASSASQCGDTDFLRRAVYWAAVDKYQRARSADPSNTRVVEIANERITQYTRQFPIRSDIFFEGHSVGGTFNVGCWINETTTVRSSD